MVETVDYFTKNITYFIVLSTLLIKEKKQR